jgi:1,2-diacylglycerol-3-alpha-glucose alpha-1,2-glucosyltransferase
MKVYIYSQFQNLIEKSGIGRAYYHQMAALKSQNVQCVDNKKDADVIHINTIFPGSVLLAKWAKRHGKAVVFHAHSTKEDLKNSFIGSNLLDKAYGKWIMMCYQLADCIITPTEYPKKLLQQNGIKLPIYVMSNGIDINYYQKKTDDRALFCKTYGYSNDAKIIMSVGLWIKRKGILDFVELAKKMPEYQFIWFGESNLHTVPQDIRKAVHEKLPNLKFAGYVDKEKLRQAYAACDLFLFPSYEETEGIVVLEALAMRIPVLIRNINEYADWLKDGRDVYKANTLTDFEVLAKNIITGEVTDTREHGHSIVEQRSIENIGKRLVNIYENAEYCSQKSEARCFENA